MWDEPRRSSAATPDGRRGHAARLAGRGPLAQVVDQQQGQVPLAGDIGEKAQDGAGRLQAGLAAGGGGGEGVDHHQGRLQVAAHLAEQLLLRGVGQVDQAADRAPA